MLRRIPGWKFQEWKYYEELEMFPDERADWNAAHIVQILAHSGGRQLREFMLPFGDRMAVGAPRQTVEYQESLIIAWCEGSNLVAAAKGNRGR